MMSKEYFFLSQITVFFGNLEEKMEIKKHQILFRIIIRSGSTLSKTKAFLIWHEDKHSTPNLNHPKNNCLSVFFLFI